MDQERKNQEAALEQDPKAEVTIPVIEEELSIATRIEIRGQVDIHKHVDFEEEELLLREFERHYDIERIAKNTRSLEAPPATRELEDGTIVYSVVREIPVVVTHYELIEEVHVRPRVSAFDRPVVMPVRRERIEVHRHHPINTEKGNS